MAGANFDTTRARLGDVVAAVSGALLFLSLFFDWYSVSANSALTRGISAGASGWESLSFIDILLFIVAIIAIGVAVARMAGALPRMAISPGLLLLGAGVLAVILVLFRLIALPGDFSDVNDVPGIDVGRSVGIFIALIASLGVTVGGWMTWNEEGRPTPGGRPVGATPVGGGPAYGGGQPGGGYDQPAASAPTAATPAATTSGTTAPAAASPAPEMASPTPSAPADAPPPGGAADWYPDPRGEKRLRYWDGSQWTHHTAD